MVDNISKNAPILESLYREKFPDKNPFNKDGSQSKAYLAFKRENFTPMGQTVMKNFQGCEPKIISGEMEPYACYRESREKAVENCNLYIPPAYRVKLKTAEFLSKYPFDELKKKYNEEFGLK